MFKIKSAIVKEFLLLLRDKVGLIFMFAMPIVLVIVMTAVQNSTFEMVNTKKIPLVICQNHPDSNTFEFVKAIQATKMFPLIYVDTIGEEHMQKSMLKHDAMVGLFISDQYFNDLKKMADFKAQNVLVNFGLGVRDSSIKSVFVDSIQLYFQPVMHVSYRFSIKGALYSVMQIIENKFMIQSIYYAVNGKQMPASFEKEMIQSQTAFSEKQIAYDGRVIIPNASQHNVPAWTLFAMFFTVISLGGNLVREKVSGSFTRLKLLPTNYMIGLLAKQLLFLLVNLCQVLVIFSIGVWVLPLLGLPALNIPSNYLGLFLVSVVCGWSAISFALCLGVYAESYEQANGFGSASIVILAAMGGVFVPSFVMPDSFSTVIKLSPFYWGLESFYGLFLEVKTFWQILENLVPLILFGLVFQTLAFIRLKSKKLI